jgi:hypothetical protein
MKVKAIIHSFIPLGLDSEMIMRPLVTEINAKLRNIVVLDSDIMALYKKVRICFC